MRHRISGKKLGRDAKGRKALFRSLAASFVHHGFIETSLPKAKAVQSIVEKLITKARKGSPASYGLVHSFLQDQRATRKLISDTAPLPTASSGFTRITRVGIRKGDASPIARLEWTNQVSPAGKK